MRVPSDDVNGSLSCEPENIGEICYSMENVPGDTIQRIVVARCYGNCDFPDVENEPHEITNPATQKVIAHWPSSRRNEVNEAIEVTEGVFLE